MCDEDLGGNLLLTPLLGAVAVGGMSFARMAKKSQDLRPHKGQTMKVSGDSPSRSTFFARPKAISSGVSTFSSAASSSDNISKAGTLIGTPESSPDCPVPKGFLMASSGEKSLSKYHQTIQRKAVARLLLLSVVRMNMSKKSRGGKKCISEILGAYCDKTNIRFTGLVRGLAWFMISSMVPG